MSEKTSEKGGRSLGARRGRSATKLHEMAALDSRLLNPTSTLTDEPTSVEDPPASDVSEPASNPPVSDGGGVEAAAFNEVAEEAPTVAEPEPALQDGLPAGDSQDPEEDSPPSRKRADFRDALQIYAWSSTTELWDRYAALGLKLRKQTGMKVPTAELIRAVVESACPDASTRSGVSRLDRYAEAWGEKLSREPSTRKNQPIRLTRRVIENLDKAQLSLLEDRGRKVAVGRMISGMADEHFPSEQQARKLLGIR